MCQPASSENVSPLGPFAAHQHLLRERLLALLAPIAPPLRFDIMKALTGDTKLLSSETEVDEIPSGVWSLLVYLLSGSLAPTVDSQISCSIAVALECYVCAIDLLDDVIDEDQTPTLLALGIPRTLCVYDALRTLSYQALLACPPVMERTLVKTLNASSLLIASGQTEDVLAEQRDAWTMSPETCIEIARAKAGSMMRLACQCAGVSASVPEGLFQTCSMMGELLGIAHQLDNDAHDLYDLLHPLPGQVPDGKSDLLRGKKTLPVVLAVQKEVIDGATLFSDVSSLAALDTGIAQTWGMSLLYRRRARLLFEQIEREVHTDVTLLRLLLGF